MPGSLRVESTSSSSSSSSETSPLTPPRPLHPPSAFSDSRELSEAECDRELSLAQAGRAAGDGATAGRSGAPGDVENLTTELTVLLQRYKQEHQMGHGVQQEHQMGHGVHQEQKLHRGSQKNPYSINV
ncbi:hypothetical protein OTU49_003408 [Cherax quadricarinatus]|uniref:Uncharacterized protein n=1 Tax=Cherax quadricarinatus TaxID=27406 RepID=A0AAW0XIS3_CHEQU